MSQSRRLGAFVIGAASLVVASVARADEGLPRSPHGNWELDVGVSATFGSKRESGVDHGVSGRGGMLRARASFLTLPLFDAGSLGSFWVRDVTLAELVIGSVTGLREVSTRGERLPTEVYFASEGQIGAELVLASRADLDVAARIGFAFHDAGLTKSHGALGALALRADPLAIEAGVTSDGGAWGRVRLRAQKAWSFGLGATYHHEAKGALIEHETLRLGVFVGF